MGSNPILSARARNRDGIPHGIPSLFFDRRDFGFDWRGTPSRGFSVMLLGMTVRTNELQIFHLVVLPVAIHVMDDENLNATVTASFTRWAAQLDESRLEIAHRGHDVLAGTGSILDPSAETIRART